MSHEQVEHTITVLAAAYVAGDACVSASLFCVDCDHVGGNAIMTTKVDITREELESLKKLRKYIAEAAGHLGRVITLRVGDYDDEVLDSMTDVCEGAADVGHYVYKALATAECVVASLEWRFQRCEEKSKNGE
jgi:hypothetical protein